MSDNKSLIEIEVAYAKPEEQVIVTINIPLGTTIGQAVRLSGLLERFPEISRTDLMAGIFGIVCTPDQAVKQGDRVEIYRPLLHDPKEARRLRALKNRAPL
jgi:uncharacterized protein